MKIHNINPSLEHVDVKTLSLPEALEELLLGGVIVLQDYEKTRGRDVLVRLDMRKHAVTKISHDVNVPEYREPYWQIHNVSINAISLHTCYEKEIYDLYKEFKYLPNQVVQIREGSPQKVYLVEKVYIDRITEERYYELGEKDGLYHESEIQKHEE